MYNSKKLFAALMASALLLSAVGCSDRPAAPSSEVIASASSTLPDSSSSSSTAPVEAPKPLSEEATRYKAMRDTTTRSSSNWPYNNREYMSKLNTDPAAKTIADLLSAANIAGESFASPAEIPAKEVVQAAIGMTQGFARVSSPSYPYYPTSEALDPIFVSVSRQLDMEEDMVWLQEHVEQSAKLLYGPDFVIEHQTVNKYKYFPEEGVYTPPHMGAGYEIYTAVLDYTDNGDTLTATVSYALESVGGISAVDDGEELTLIAPEQLADHLQNDAVRHTVTLSKNADGSLHIVSQQPA